MTYIVYEARKTNKNVIAKVPQVLSINAYKVVDFDFFISCNSCQTIMYLTSFIQFYDSKLDSPSLKQVTEKEI